MMQKAHYQHTSQFPYCARRVGRSSVPTSRTGNTIGISTSALDHQPTRLPPGKSPKSISGPTLQNRDYHPTGKPTHRLPATPTPNQFSEIDFRSLPSLVTRTYVTPWATAFYQPGKFHWNP